jgi:hypothetical protein
MGQGLKYAGCLITGGLLVYIAIGLFAAVYITLTTGCLICGAYGGFVWPLWVTGVWTIPDL